MWRLLRNEAISWNCRSSFAQGSEAWPEAARKGQGQLGAYGNVEARCGLPYRCLYYALTATKKSEREAVIFEVDSSKLNPFRLCPDEDFLAQAAQVGAPAFKDIKEQYDNDLLKMTAHFRDELEEYSDDWEASVKHMGNCCFIGNIPVEAITRYALIPNIYKFVQWSDPTIGIMNYRVLGEYYQALSKRVFGDETDYVSEYGFYKLPTQEEIADVQVIELRSAVENESGLDNVSFENNER